MASMGFAQIWSLVVIVSLILVPLSWIALYVRGAEARDLIFWGAISVVIPLLGPVAALAFALRLKAEKLKHVESDPT